jgi:iron complex outermembrane recepter protein
MTGIAIVLASAGVCRTTPSLAQSADANAVVEAQDAFGYSRNGDSIGLYGTSNVRGFSPAQAGNLRIEGYYFDHQAHLSTHAVDGTQVHVGLTALDYPFAAPSGIVEYELKLSARDRAALTATAGTLDGRDLFADFAKSTLGRGFSVAGGIGLHREPHPLGSDTEYLGLGLVLRRAAQDSRSHFTFFSSRLPYRSQRTDPVLYGDGSSLPAPFRPGTTLGQRWAEGHGLWDNTGVMFDQALSGSLDLRGALFRSEWHSERDFDQVITNATRDGFGDALVYAYPDRRARAYSADVRLVRENAGEKFRARTTLAIRGRSVERRTDGAQELALGHIRLADDPQFAPPPFAFAPQSTREITNIGLGLVQQLSWQQRAEVLFGLERARHEGRVVNAGATAATQEWLYDIAAAWHPYRDIVLFASMNRGLEDAGIAPAGAANRGTQLPAILSTQREIGVRFGASSKFALSVGAFQLAKPYPGLAADGTYRLVGDLRNRGVEVSLSTRPLAGLTVLSGIYAARPQTDRGSAPSGSFTRQAQLYLDYAPPALPAMSFDVRYTYQGKTAVTASLMASERSTVDIGARVRAWRIHHPLTLRLVLQNALDDRGWLVDTSGGLSAVTERTLVATLTLER